MKAKGVIFDVDGSLYKFDRGKSKTFEQSLFSRVIRENVIRFFQRRFGLTKKEAEARFEALAIESNGELSLWLERHHGIPRSEYFAETWDLRPARFMDPDDTLVACLGDVAAKRAILSSAPRIWIDSVVDFLKIGHLFEQTAIFSGEPDVRKPHPEAFLQVSLHWGLAPAAIVSIGDQELSDILPAKALGMRTVLLGGDASSQADFVAPDLPSAIKLLKKENIL